jgi:glycosyltransferase involved in cell wall biosynthesis
MKIPVSVIILTFNEQANISHALESTRYLSDDIHIVDSGSTDETIKIALQYNTHIHHHEWQNWADQRNWALKNCTLKYEWALFLDADEQMTPEAAKEILQKISNPNQNIIAFYLSFDFYFMNKKIRNAMNPHLRLVQKNKVTWQVSGAREYCSAPPDSPIIQAALIHHDHRGLKFWLKKQLRNARLEAVEKYNKRKAKKNRPHRTNSKTLQKQPRNTSELKTIHHIRNFIDTYCPPFILPPIALLYRIICKRNFLDGIPGICYTFLFGFWYPLMIDIKYVKLLLTKKIKK